MGHGLPTFAAWLRPGQAGLTRSTKTFASGTANGKAWQLTAYSGPWGTCIEGGDAGDCFDPGTQHRGTSELGASGSPGSGTYVFGTAADSVSYLIVTPQGGSATRVGVTEVGQQKYWGFSLDREPRKSDRWTAYNAAGQPVASGSLS